jgi:hypothetical protein
VWAGSGSKEHIIDNENGWPEGDVVGLFKVDPDVASLGYTKWRSSVLDAHDG